MSARRLIVVFALLLVALVAGEATASAESEDRRHAIGAPSPRTPVLSARRVPDLLAAPVADRRLRLALSELLTRQPGTACLTVSSAGRPVFAHDDDVSLTPASVEKLLTAVVALDVLGPDHRFRTRVLAEAPPVGGAVAGDVWVVGGGDAILATDDYAARFRNQPQITTSTEALADAVVAAGVTAIEGSVVGDESRYDDDRYPDAWPARFITQDVSGPLSALTINDNWTAFPPNPDTNVPDETPADDPARHAAGVVTSVLVERGVAVAGAPAAGPAPPGAVEIAAIESPPLTEVIAEMLRESDNQTAELVTKELAVARGRPGTTADGIAVVTEVLVALDFPLDGVVVSDGSGLGLDNRLTCELVQAVLDRAGPDSPIAGGLPVAGVSGTLALRFLDSPVTGRMRAKTGTLNQVTSLAGYVATDGGADLSFTYIANLVEPDRVDAPDLAFQDELAAILATYPSGPPLTELDPN